MKINVSQHHCWCSKQSNDPTEQLVLFGEIIQYEHLT